MKGVADVSVRQELLKQSGIELDLDKTVNGAVIGKLLIQGIQLMPESELAHIKQGHGRGKQF